MVVFALSLSLETARSRFLSFLPFIAFLQQESRGARDWLSRHSSFAQTSACLNLDLWLSWLFRPCRRRRASSSTLLWCGSPTAPPPLQPTPVRRESSQEPSADSVGPNHRASGRAPVPFYCRQPGPRASVFRVFGACYAPGQRRAPLEAPESNVTCWLGVLCSAGTDRLHGIAAGIRTD